MLRNSVLVLLFAWLVLALPALAQEISQQASLPLSELTEKLERALGLVEEDSKVSRAQALSLLDEVEEDVQALLTDILEQADTEERKLALITLGRYKMNSGTTKAMIFARQGEHQRATAQLERLMLYLAEHGDVFSRANTLKAWADILLEINKPAEAAQKYSEALALLETRAEELGDFIRYTRLSYFQSLEALGRSKEALQQLDFLLQDSEAIPEESKRGRALQQLYFSRGFFYLRLGHQQEARADLEALMALPYVQARPAEHFRAAVALATVIQREGDIAARRALLEEAEGALKSLKPEEISPGDLGLFYLFKGTTELADENMAEGLENLSRADELHKLSGQGGLSSAFFIKFSVYRGLGRVGELIPELKEYLDTVTQPTLSDLQLQLSYCQAIAELGQPDEALRLLEDLSEELEERQAKVLQIDTLTTMAGIYDTFQLDQHSNDYYQKALSLAEETQNREKILSLKVALFRVSLRQPYYLKNHQDFLHDFQELVELTQVSGDAGEMALVLSGYVRQMLDAREFENARIALLQMKESIGAHSPVLEAFVVLGESSIDRQSENLSEAERHLQALTSMAKREHFWRMRRALLTEALRWRMLLGQDLNDHPMVEEYEGLSRDLSSPQDQLQDYSFRADLSKYRGRPEDFIHSLEVAEALLWSLRDSSSSSDFRTAYYSDANKIYGGLVAQLIEEGRFNEAFEAAERGRGQALVSLFEKSEAKIAQSATAQQRSKLDQLYARRDELERGLMKSDFGQEQTLTALKAVVADIDAILSEIALAKSSGPGYLSQQVVQVSALRKLLAPQQVMLRYFVTNDTTYLFVLSKDEELQVHKLPGGVALMDKIRAYREAIQNLAKDVESKRLELSSLLLGPLSDLDRFPEKIIVPDGPLYLLPFGNLGTLNGRPLYESQVTILPSAKMFAQLKKEGRSSERGRSITVMADPTYTVPISDSETKAESEVRRLLSEVAQNAPAQLPGTLEEALMVKEVAQEKFQVQLYLGVQANRERLFQLSDSGLLNQSRIVHFATHGFTIPSDPRLSGLILSLVNGEGEASNGFLRLVDIYRLDLNADLVVLSACQTGLGTIRDGDGLQGLYQGFLMAGSRGVLNTLWSVDDAATTEFMRHFYKSLMQGESPKRALSLAQQTMAKSTRWSEPFFWAGFQLVSP